MSGPSRDPSIHEEPHLQGLPPKRDFTEADAGRRIDEEMARETDADKVEHTVWDEPTVAPQIVGEPPADQLTYARWLEQRIAATSSSKSWFVTLLLVLVAGPWGVIGALGGGGGSSFGLVMLTVIGPVTEEIMKIAAALWVVEKRPYLFKSGIQIMLCAAAGGIAFAFIENLIYLFVYVPDHSFGFAAWRWTVCVGLHLNCSFVAGVGLVRIWGNAIRERHRPILALGVPFFVMAMVGHGLYNAGVIVAESAGWLEF